MIAKLTVLSLLLVSVLAYSRQPPQPRCGVNEVFYECGACDSNCFDDLNCTYKRNRHGVCIPPEECPRPMCGPNEQFFECGACDKTCWNMRPACNEICRLYGSCGCKNGFVRNGKWQCVPYAQCRWRG
uniref:TIL domain-containing protein n=1 Tax=Steinernema glaseri TaxID=37863 RepID=A0A1I8AU11_9BILA